ncbi:CPBP family intramembrane glutamic endopeptidase [Vibrio sonorensis]|uniref:CPBP family glutamic-type intramembrane protease n=1 Tax=Vibrio sonorensis TaxID=1004316 RepID=UPI001586BDAF
MPNIISIISLIFIAPFVEEFFLRLLFINRMIDKGFHVMIPVATSSVFFSIIHDLSIIALLSGLLFGLLYVIYRNILIPMLIHSFYNLFSVLMEACRFYFFGPYSNFIIEVDSQWIYILLLSGTLLITMVSLYKLTKK